MVHGGSPPLFFQKRFTPLWSAFCLGAFADNMLRQALIVGIPFGYITFQHVDVGDEAVPVIGALFAAAMLIFSPLAGQFADKYETAFMVRRTKFAEFLIMAFAAIGFFLNSGALLVCALFLMAAQSAFFSPVRTGAMPKYFGAGELIRANALFNAGLFVAILSGLSLGGLLIIVPGGGWKVALALLLASLLGWAASMAAPYAKANDPSLHIDWNIPARAAILLKEAFAAPGVARPALGIAFFFFTSTHITVLTPFFARDALGAGGGVASLIMVVYAVGAWCGAVAAANIPKGRNGFGVSAFGILAATLATIMVVALAPAAAAKGGAVEATLSIPVWQALYLCLALSALFMNLYLVPLQAAVQRRAPPDHRSRVLAANNMLNAAAAIAGSLAALFVTQTALGALDALIAICALQTVAVVYIAVRHMRTPRGLYDETLGDEPGGLA